MNNSISAQEVYTSLMAVCIIVLAFGTKVLGDDPITDTILLLVTVVLMFNFAYKSYKARRCTSEQKPAGE